MAGNTLPVRDRYQVLSGNALKLIAIVTMLIDHVAYRFGYLFRWPAQYWIMRGIGRLAFPIYCFLLVEGFFHTRSAGRYLLRLGIFALISEVPFDICMYGTVFYPGYQNVMLTLFIGLAALICYRWCVRRTYPIYAIMVIIAALVVGWLAKCDYGAEGVALIFLFYILHESTVGKLGALAIWCVLMGGVEMVGIAAIIPILLYSGERGRGGKAFQYFGYAFYPVHLFVIGMIFQLL